MFLSLAEHLLESSYLHMSHSNSAQDYWELCNAAINGHYEHSFFETKSNTAFDLTSVSTISRLRAVVQYLNAGFSETIQSKGHKFQIDITDKTEIATADMKLESGSPTIMSKIHAERSSLGISIHFS